MRNARLIYNPTSGREEMKRRLADILHRLDSAGIETSCHATTGEGDATREAADAVERGYDLVIAPVETVRLMRSSTGWPAGIISSAGYFPAGDHERFCAGARHLEELGGVLRSGDSGRDASD